MKRLFILFCIFTLIITLIGCRRTTTTIENKTTKSTEIESIDVFSDDMLEYILSKDTTSYHVSSAYESNIEELIIPSTHNNLPVRYIDRLEKFSNLKKLIIPDTIYQIDSSAFSFCPNIVYNEYESGLYVGTNDNPYFYLYKPVNQKIESIEVHTDCKIIGCECFINQTKIKTVVLPEGIKRIGYSAFMSALNLVNINLPDSLEFIDVQAFSYCKALTKVKIPTNLTLISESTFVNCNSLSNVELNEGLETIMLGAFQGCSALESITIPSSVKTIYEKAFFDCPKLRKVIINSQDVANINKDITLFANALNLFVKDDIVLGKYLSDKYNQLENSTMEGYKQYRLIQ